ncbi:MAG: hypothetical protein FJX16_08430 [Alphaproteobacteria bacterium]|nr:hypothetical protein [Alphaproteobacteria bacterium]MBM3625329.1 hypothetical protein [Alphaproteobacteria bacterium]
MKLRHLGAISTITVLSMVSLSESAFAFCGVLQASASGYSREEALSKANNKGLVEVRRLEANYGRSAVHYQPAVSTCREGGRVSCSISQKFCVDSGQRQRPARGEEGHSMHGCPPGTRQVPETDNCVPVRKRSGEFESQPWKKPGCRAWKQSCDRGDARACGKYESTCQVN